MGPGHGVWRSLSVRCRRRGLAVVVSLHVTVVLATVDADGQLDESFQFPGSPESDDLVLDRILEALVEAVDQRFVFPMEDGRVAAELGGIGGSGTGLSEEVEFSGSRNAELGVAEDFVDLCGEEGKVGHPGRGSSMLMYGLIHDEAVPRRKDAA